jgi:hypothetical protein
LKYDFNHIEYSLVGEGVVLMSAYDDDGDREFNYIIEEGEFHRAYAQFQAEVLAAQTKVTKEAIDAREVQHAST